MDHAALQAWLDAYKRAWEERDPDQAAALFTEDAVYAETPFDPPAIGHDGIRQYWADATAPQRDVTFGYTILATDPVVAHWTAEFTTGGTPGRLDGVFLLDFAADGRCSHLREWWFYRQV